MAERLLRPELDRPAFDPSRVFSHGSQHSEARFTNGTYQIVSMISTGQYGAFNLDRVIGDAPLRQFLVPFPGGREQTLEASYDPSHDHWFNVYGSEDRQPGEWGHWTGRGMNWNSMCAACHNTRLRKNYDPTNDVYSTTQAEISVGCEACHGPMKDHAAWSSAHRGSSETDPTLHKLSKPQMLDTCLTCHSRRMELTGDFAPGESFDDHYLLTIPDETELFYPDGQVHDEDYEGAPFLGSKMHGQAVTCGDCHQPHSSKTLLPGNLLCMRCHNGSVSNAPVIVPATHSFHKTDTLYESAPAPDLVALARRDPEAIGRSGGECVNCHMPQTTYMQRHLRHDHGFSVPDPTLTKKFGIPNACNRCHKDKDTDWAVTWTEKWYGNKMDRPTRTRTETIANARMGKPEAHDGLLKLFESNESSYWRATAANLLGRWIGEPAVRAAMLKAVADTNAIVRSYAARNLGPLADTGDSQADAALRRLLNDPARSVRFTAAWALRGLIDEQSAATRELLEIVEFLSDQPAGRMQHGAWLLARNKPDLALAAYQKAVEWDPNSAPIRHDLGVVLSILQRSTEAIEQLEAACQLQPRDAEYRFKLALAYHEAGRNEKTVEALEETVRLNPLHSRAWYNLGLARYSAGNIDGAMNALVRAESADPNDPRSPYARATILANMGRTDEARRAAQRALEIQPQFPEAQQLLQSLPASKR
jgi:tetratricopeptide (TPR) repeat protein